MSALDTNTAYDRVRAALIAAGSPEPPRGTDWCCPSHDDRSPSLSVNTGRSGGVVLHCQAGCSIDDVLAVLHIKKSDLFDQPATRNGSTIVATYPYVDENGGLLFEVVRKEPKAFLQRRPDGNGDWIWKLDDIRRVLYRLPAVSAAVDAGEPIWVVEGEKDVHTLERVGQVATCNPQGAGKWRPEYTDQLAGARAVIVVADRDKTGVAHARAVEAALTPVVESVTVVHFAIGKDAAEHLAMGGHVEDLVDVDDAVSPMFDTTSATHDAPAENSDAAADGEWRSLFVDGRTWLTTGSDAVEALWGDARTVLAVRKQPTTIVGPQGAGKTVLGQRLTLGWLGIGDGELLGLPITPGEGSALVLAADRPDQSRLSMGRMVREADLEVLAERLVVWQGPPPFDLARAPSLLVEMAAHVGASFVLLDSLKDIALKLSDDDVGAGVNRAIQLAIARGIEIVALHHPRKLGGADRPDRPRSLDDVYGSYWLTAGSGSVLYLHPGEVDTIGLLQLKTPNGVNAELTFSHRTGTGDVTLAQPTDLLAIVESTEYEGITVAHAARCLYRVDDPEQKHKKAVSRKLAELTNEGLIEKVPKPEGTAIAQRWRTAT